VAVLDKLLKLIEEYTLKLDEIKDVDDWITYQATLHMLQVQAQALIDLIRRLLSNMGISTDSYRESVKKLFENKLVTEEEFRFLNSVVSFRNILVHAYATVSQDVVRKIIRERSYRKLLEIAINLKRRAEKYWDP